MGDARSMTTGRLNNFESQRSADRVYSFTTISSLSVIKFPKIERAQLNSVQKSDSFSLFASVLVIFLLFLSDLCARIA